MRLYRALLPPYPASFRAEYGAELCAMFARRLREASGGDLVASSGPTPSSTSFGMPHSCTGTCSFRMSDTRCARWLEAPGFALHRDPRRGARDRRDDRGVFDHRPRAGSGRCRSPTPTGWSGCGRTRRFAGIRGWSCRPATYLDWKTPGDLVRRDVRLHDGVGKSGRRRRPERGSTARWSVPMSSTFFACRRRLGAALTSVDDLEHRRRTWSSSATACGAPNLAAIGRHSRTHRRPRRRTAFVIVGVMPAGVRVPHRDVAVLGAAPIQPERRSADRTDTYLDVVARLQRRRVARRRAQRDASHCGAARSAPIPKENAQTSATVHLLRDQVSQQARTLLMTLVGAASACC